MNKVPARGTGDLTDLLSDVWFTDQQANNPRTRDFLEAGEQLLRKDLLGGIGPRPGAGERTPFDELLAWLSRRRVVTEALRAWDPDRRERDSGPTEAAYRYRWRTQAGYLRDLVIWALGPRMKYPAQQIRKAREKIDAVKDGKLRLPASIEQIACDEVENLKDDPAFRLQMIFQASLAPDPCVADALRRIDKANVDAWTRFVKESFGRIGLSLRDGIEYEHLGCALHAAGEGSTLRALLPERTSHAPISPGQLLAFIAKSLIVAAAKPDDDHGQALDEILDQLLRRHLASDSARAPGARG